MVLLQRRLNGPGNRFDPLTAVAILGVAFSGSWSMAHAALVSLRMLLCMLRLVKAASPWVAGVGVWLYTGRLIKYAWLRQEWSDFIWGGILRRFRIQGDAESTCSICAENVPDTRWHYAVLPCCEKSLCWKCVRNHAESVVDDLRPDMRCPYNRCMPLPDTYVHSAIRREQWSWATLDLTGRVASRKKRAYERWVIARGLAETCAARAEDVVHCPVEDCGHMWVLPQALRKGKSETEPQSRWDPRAWKLTRIIGMYAPREEDGRDLRRVNCPKCSLRMSWERFGRVEEEDERRLDFCLLCGKMWTGPGKRSTLTHSGKSCVEYIGHTPGRCSDEVRMTGAKPCPGCGVPVLRSWGCNHMTCTQCRCEWCWVCMDRWSGQHYSCVPVTRATGEQNCCVQ